ncbi:MAG: hypothetical protein ACXW2E_01670 [Nitrososphaeraceae archaeon]
MAIFNWAETFISLEGEFLFQGSPTTYCRLTNCNFTCQKFNNPNNLELTNDVLGFNPKDYHSLKDLPLISMGCDSLYAHDRRFSHLWKSGSEDELANELINLLPTKSWIHPKTGYDYIFSITGGEPTLYQKQLPYLLFHKLMMDIKRVLIETNGSVPLRDSFIHDINSWIASSDNRTWIWSNSPKLSASGELWDRAVRPEIICKQRDVVNFVQYFKFVCGPRSEDFDEIEKAMSMYFPNGIPGDVIVGVMPEACTFEQQNDIAKEVADMCIKRGFVYVHRLQNSLWGNEVGT